MKLSLRLPPTGPGRGPEQIDGRAANGDQVGALAGVPFIAKDNFLVFGAETTAASNILKGFTAPYQSTAIERLEAAGAICVAKANLDAFAHGSSTENSDFMVTRNRTTKSVYLAAHPVARLQRSSWIWRLLHWVLTPADLSVCQQVSVVRSATSRPMVWYHAAAWWLWPAALMSSGR
jgi:hypothetical protein